MALRTRCGASTPSGFFEAIVPQDAIPNSNYVLRAENTLGGVVDLNDPYSFGPLLSDFDLYLISEGSHYRTYEKLGAHLRESTALAECTSRYGRPTPSV